MTTEFFARVEEESNRFEDTHGSMTKVSYHQYYLAQEAIRRLSEYQEIKRKPYRDPKQRVVAAFVSLMGEFNKRTGNRYGRDFNKIFCGAVEEVRAVIIGIQSDNVASAIKLLQDYCKLDEDSRNKAINLLLMAAVLVMREWSV